MLVHIFQCSISPIRYGLTDDKTGAKLPAQACKSGVWKYVKNVTINADSLPFISGITAQEILEAIQRDGYAIYEVKIMSRFE